MSLLSLRESLNRSKVKWKNRFNLNSNTTSLETSTHIISPLSGLRRAPPIANVSSQVNDYHIDTITVTSNLPQKEKTAWSTIKSLLTILESTTKMFSPLHSAISRLSGCIDIYESLSKERKEYDYLQERLERLLSDLSEHMANPTRIAMTNSLQRICSDIEVELRNVEKIRARNTIQRLVDNMERSDELLECYHRIQGHIERLTLNTNMNILREINEQTMEARLARMSPSMSAIYNSAESDDVKRGNCAPGTREPQINLLLEWALHGGAGRICWINGMAGTGKTTIAFSASSRLDAMCKLGASFFCSRTIPECRQAKYIIPTIAYQLARFSFPFRCALDRALQHDPDAHTRALKVQYYKLIVEPILEAKGSLPTDFIVVIDALDECESKGSLGQILDLLISPDTAIPIRFLLSSRPEPEINQRMMDRVAEQGDTQLVLHDLDSDSVNADIEAYMRHELKHIPLTETHWFGLLKQCGVLFIYASTTCRYIEQAHNMNNLDEAVDTIVGSASVPMDYGDEQIIDELYLTILAVAFNKPGLSQTNKRRMRDILETVICAVEPMTLNSLAGLLRLESAKQVDSLLQPLRSVLNVSGPACLVSTLHASFPDFMFSPARAQTFCCIRAKRNTELAEACLCVIEQVEPKFNICSLPSSYLLDDEVENLAERVRQSISTELSYACCYWSVHLYLGEYQDQLVEMVRNFFSKRLLIWMEILNLTRRMHYGASVLQDAGLWCSEKAVPSDIEKLAHDAWLFVSVYANHPVSRSTPHIYISMLPFWPPSRPISDAYLSRTVGMIQLTGTATTRRQLALLASWRVSSSPVYSIGLSGDGTQLVAATGNAIDIFNASTGDAVLNVTERVVNVDSVSISPDGTRIAFGCTQSALYLWEAINGGNVIILCPDLFPKYDLGVVSTAFSSDGSCVAFSSASGGVYIFSLQRGELVLDQSNGHATCAYSVSFSPDGLYLASGSGDKSVRLWDVKTGHMIGSPFEGHSSLITSVAYSPDGSLVASGPLGEQSHKVESVAFSPNGRFIASGSSVNTILVYDVSTGQIVLGPLEGHTGPVNRVLFSPDSTRLFSCSSDGTIRVWDMQDLEFSELPLPVAALSSHINSVRYSHDGMRIVSGSRNGVIHVWDVWKGEMIVGPLYGHSDSIESLDYSPKNAYIASASQDKTIRIWGGGSGEDLHGPLRGHDSAVKCVRFSPDSSLVSSGSLDGTVRIWNFRSGQMVVKLFGDSPFTIYSVGFSADGRFVFSASGGGRVRVAGLNAGQTIDHLLPDRNSLITSVDFSPDGSRILSCSYDQSIHIWNGQTMQKLLDFGSFRPWEVLPLTMAVFSPSNCYVASCYEDHTIRIWETQTGRLVLGPLRGHSDGTRSIQFSPDESHIVSCSRDRTIRFWNITNHATNGQIDVDDSNEAADSGQNANATPGHWSLDSDGWVTDSQDRRLVWVPSDMRNYLLWSFNDSLIADRGWFKFDFDRANVGELWTDCYRP
ncbi:unnamed protein product [Rhizoctonia solani]|uniref:Nephrocystin 3-like N-terminal domain-containing protein n=1 Tax=Rhizoctonia solani TaxID=456999 RepID=A0A8H2WXF5_9AGAM|nr:unnamed protein product [Rhizoctonia solani]